MTRNWRSGRAQPRDRLERYWSLPVDDLLAALGSSREGLTADEAAKRLAAFGPNLVRSRPQAETLRLLLRQYESPLIWILMFAAAIAALVGDWTDALIVAVILLGSGALGFVQEYRAGSALAWLQARIETRAKVLRDRRETTVPSRTIVTGDVVLLEAGSLAPADGIVLESKDFFVIEAALTGESMPVEKAAGMAARDANVARRTNCVFMGTSVRSGIARALIVRTGAATEYGLIAERLRLRPPETEFELSLRRYGVMLTEIMLLLVLVVFAVNVLLARPAVDALLFAVALAVGLSPELLPAIVSVTLSRGARDMARRGVIVRRLNAIENLGSMDVLCSDKTGTLTVGVMVLDRALDADGAESAGLLARAYLNAALQTGLANPLDQAIVARGRAEGLDLRLARTRKLDEIPYDFVRKRLSVVVVDGAGDAVMITKGAVDKVLEICDRVRVEAGVSALDAKLREAVLDHFGRMSAEGFRVLGIAERRLDTRPGYARSDEHGLVFLGFLSFRDPPKPGIARTLADLAALGVCLKIITGDNRFVARHVAAVVGLAAERMLTGEALDRLGDDALWRAAEAADLFVEVDPGQKERIILALKKGGHVVGYLGDGINDAPALHAADVGISVDGAVDVAREAADLVLLEHDLDVLSAGIADGRATFANTLKYVSITTSANFGNMLSMAAASFVLPFLPLLAKQILLNNFLSDIPAMAISGDRVDRAWLRRPHRWQVRDVRNFMLVFGGISSVFDVVTFAALLLLFKVEPELFRTAWFVESLLTELMIMLVVRTARPAYLSRPGGLLVALTLTVGALTLALPYLPGLAYFGFVPVPLPVVGALLAILVAYLAASEAAKRLFYRREEQAD